MDRLWEAELKSFSQMASGITGKNILVRTALNGDLGYTGSGTDIFIAKEHPIFTSLYTDDVHVIRYGICVHEALHQVFTNFDYISESVEKMKKVGSIKSETDEKMYRLLVNLVEDPAIENMAGEIVGGLPLKALDFAICKIYELSKNDSKKAAYPISEIINALIQFGDLGIITYNFEFDVANMIFKRISKLFYDAINEPDSRKRIDKVLPIYLECAKLWVGRDEKKKQAMQQENQRIADKHGKNSIDKNATGSGSNGRMDENSGLNQKRREAMEKLSGEKKSTDGSQSPAGLKQKSGGTDKDSAAGINQKNDAKPSNGSSQNESNEQEKKSKTENDDRNKGEKEEKEEKGEKTGKGEKSNSSADPVNNTGEHNRDAYISEEDKSAIIDDIYNNLYDEDRTNMDEARYNRPFEEFLHLKEHKFYKKFKVINSLAPQPSQTDCDKYNQMVALMADGISKTVQDMQEIFIADRARKVYCESGKVSLDRVASNKVTTRLFRKRRLSGHKKDMAVMVVGDNSGSMSAGDKLLQEKLAVIALAEIFGECDIPFYFFGFNTLNVSPVQTHFIRWDNTLTERARVVSMTAGGQNFDAYSISYAAELLKERPEKHKVLFVISDGLPSFSNLRIDGIKANTIAINEARIADIDVIGFGVGNVPQNVFEGMYKKEFFIHVKEPNDLFVSLVARLKALLENW